MFTYRLTKMITCHIVIDDKMKSGYQTVVDLSDEFAEFCECHAEREGERERLTVIDEKR